MDLREMGGDWPREAERKYERMEVLGRGSFGMVWMSRRMTAQEDEFDDEYVAIKNINIKDEKGKVYAEREICILQELRHPNVIRLIRSYNVHCGDSRLVVMQLARGPNLHQLVVKRGALGIPLGRLVSRQLIAAVSYLHGRAVIHRDIKPSNCILACTNIPLTQEYDWYADHAIWNSSPEAIESVAAGKWKLMLVDFGFARALEHDEIMAQARPMRNSIVFEMTAAPPTSATKSSAASSSLGGKSTSSTTAAAVAATAVAASTILEEPESQEIEKDDSDVNKDEKANGEESKVEESNKEKEGAASTSDVAAAEATATPATTTTTTTTTGSTGDNATVAAFTHLNDRKQGPQHDDDDTDDDEILGRLAEQAASRMKLTSFEPSNELENEIMGTAARKRISGVSMPIDANGEGDNFNTAIGPGHGGGHHGKVGRRISTARHKVRSMSALGTKAYAAPEIRKKLRHKTDADFSKANAAMTECVADYGMIVDSYSVGWTLRVALTGVPPNFTISEYMMERDMVYIAGDDDKSAEMVDTCCGCIKATIQPGIRIRDPSMIPHDATLLIAHMTEKNPEDRITVREAQNHPWITGPPGETPPYVLPQGDVPAKHGDPVVPLNCAPALSKLTVQYHMQ